MGFSMERVVKNRSGSFDAYAGPQGEHVATCRTKLEAILAIEEWNALHPPGTEPGR